MNSRVLLVAFVVLGTAFAGSVQADWTQTVFPVKNHNFGTVAVASKTEFRFPVVNTFTTDLHIRSVRESCGCTTAIIETETIAPGETGSILARFNTPTFRGKKGATLTVVIDKPFYSEVLLRVDGYIRSDMVFHPGAIEMGTINQGEPKSGSTKLFYAGRSDWQVMDIRSNTPWLVPSFKQTERGAGKANYELSVEVREDAPEGFFQDELIVQTNDRSMPNVPLRVTGTVESALSIAPQSIAVGTIKPGDSVSQRLAIRGRKPFAIESIECEGWKVDFTASEDERMIHMVNITLTADSARGNQRVPMVIRTKGENAVTAKAILTGNIAAEQVAKAQ
ncbi:DUF1573 domain-containing protein [Rhodopirellula sp. JC740]|uniref:DUF1573 domain-containing protein n=1 Tax=Rhodopirellula halodulae TaxID=2894198 RepID=A0ABS8NP90_9BACT|nr:MULTISPECIES: DUF1573 domain-containing protein [unclassified Rhodopirellula]MCC9645315.1 DUF1573 domain-containing protein [Rhodopirellula sp. JC740]MCC9655717.1 DUF1573 domain-containing protein [Rhodopirellula sp. JC737]